MWHSPGYPAGGRRSARPLRREGPWLLAAGLAACLGILHGAPPPRNARPAAGQINFLHLTINEGLSQNVVNAILQDRRGFMWFGTEDGLDRYDGYTFRTFSKNPDDPHSLCDDNVRTLCQDRAGRIWAGTANGVSVFDPVTEQFGPAPGASEGGSGPTHPWISAICEDGGGAIWIAAEESLSRRDPATGRWSHFRFESGDGGPLSHPAIHALTTDRSGTLWVGTQDGLYRHEPETGRFRRIAFPSVAAAVPPPEAVSCLYRDPHGAIWIAVRMQGLFRCAAGSERPVPVVVESDWGEIQFVKAMAMDPRGRLWAGSHGSGVLVIEPESGRVRPLRHLATDPASLGYDLINQIFCSPGDIMWVATYGKGVDYWSPYLQKFECYQKNPLDPDSLGVVSVRALFEDAGGRLWVGGYNGLDRLDRATGKFEHLRDRLPQGGIVRAICADPLEPARRLWLGMEENDTELYAVDRQTGKVEAAYSFERLVGIQARSVFDLMPEASGDLWIGTQNGLFRLQVRTRTLTHFRSDPADSGSLSHPRVNVVFRDSGGVLWAGTHGGLDRLDPGTGVLSRFRSDPADPASLSHRTVTCITEARPGVLWVGTFGGLNRFDTATGKAVRLGTREGLPNDVIYGILPDSRGCLWMSTNKGLSRYDPASGAFRNFDPADGLQSYEFNGDSYFRSASGELFFGGINGFNIFRPEAIVDNPHPPPVMITELLIDNQPVPIGPRPDGSTILSRSLIDTREITLSPRDRMLTLGFVALNYLFPGKNQFAYRLEGWDRGWQRVGSRRYVSWANLPAGDYRFRVRATNNDGVWNERGAGLVLHVLPPFYATWWFRALMAALLAAAVTAIHFARTVRIRNRNRQLEAINAALREQIAERQRAEEELRQSEEKYRTLAENLTVGIFRASACPDSHFLEVNPALVQMLGCESRPALLGRPLGGIFADPAAWADLCRQLAQWRIGRMDEAAMVRADGAKIWCSMAAAAKENPDGTVRHVDGILEDITARKALEAQVRQSQKLEAIGQLAGGIAHDFNNILTVINGRAEMGLLQCSGEDPLYQNLYEILQSGRHAGDLVRQLLAFGRRQAITRIPLDLNSTIRNLERMLRRLIGEDITLSTALAPGLPAISADPGQLEQVLMNLTVNARDALRERNSGPREPRITVETGLTVLDETSPATRLGNRSGPHAVLSVSDTGVGMTEEVRNHIFEPFFTTKPPGQGTGLGLATVFGIVQQNEGSIAVYSELGVGTTIRIYWPVSALPLEETLGETESVPGIQGQETILVVEDDVRMRKLTVETLRGFGYNVLHAPDGIEALQRLAEAGIAIDLLLTDVIMPRMSGPKLAEEMRRARPGLRVLFTSGYTDRHLVEDGAIRPAENFLAKPFTLQALGRKVREVLDRPTG